MGQVTAPSPPDVELASVESLELAAAQQLPLAWPGQTRRAWSQISLVTDAAMLAGAAFCADVWARASGSATSWAWALVLVLVTVFALNRKRLHRAPLHLRVIDSLVAVAIGTAIATSVTITLRVVFGNPDGIAAESLRLGVLATVFVGAGRVAITLRERHARRVGSSGSRALIVGAGQVGRRLAKRLTDIPEFGLRPVGFLDKEPLDATENDVGLPVLGASWDFDQVVREHRVEDVVITFSTAPADVYLRLVKRSQELGLRTSIIPRLYEKATIDTTVECLGGLPLATGHARNPKGWEFATKYALDRVVAVLMLVLLAPVYGTLALAVYISLGRPILYQQERIGLDGKRFWMLKFRSMRPPDPTEATDDRFVLPEDTAPGGVEGADRRTRVGSIMRALSFDELPQLVNVAKGEMSFVGPRPERPEFVEQFEQRVRGYGDRHRVKSGITGWAQVHGLRGQTSIADRAEWDNYYIENWSLWLDLKILLLTVVAVLRVRTVA
jgi:exopolysaccharide biosynthesis polyprenyl glycosylphosphotransferase